MSKHTPGPWEVKRQWSNECEIVPRIVCKPDEDRGCGWIADMIGAPYLGHESTLPNAYLVAAAPDLLAVVTELASVKRAGVGKDLMERARAAIARATTPSQEQR